MKVLRHRNNGNCFSTSITQACISSKDQNLKGKSPEFKIFGKDVLESSDFSKELSVALKYLVDNNYNIKIYDPDPYDGENWGSYLRKSPLPKNLKLSIKNPSKRTISKLNKDGYYTVLATMDDTDNPHPHGVLILPSGKIKDPQNESYWKKSKYSVDDYLGRSKKRFLIAVKK